MTSRLINRNILASRGRSSMRLEPEIWDALGEICRREKLALGDLVRQVEGDRGSGGRTSAMRIFAFNYFRAAATEDGHRRAGHGTLVDGLGQESPSGPPALDLVDRVHFSLWERALA